MHDSIHLQAAASHCTTTSQSHPMGNILSDPSPVDVSRGKVVVLSDGTVHEFDQPINVAELMLEHPRQFVAEVHLFSKITPLPADHILDPRKVYAMLPMARSNKAATLSTEEVRRLLASLGRGAEKEKDALLTANGEDVGRTEWPTELSTHKYSRKRWKPSLGTIEEGHLIRKLPHWLF